MITFITEIDEQKDGHLSIQTHADGVATRHEMLVANFLAQILPPLLKAFSESEGAETVARKSTTVIRELPPDRNQRT